MNRPLRGNLTGKAALDSHTAHVSMWHPALKPGADKDSDGDHDDHGQRLLDGHAAGWLVRHVDDNGTGHG